MSRKKIKGSQYLHQANTKLAISYLFFLIPIIYIVGLQMSSMSELVLSLEQTKQNLNIAKDTFSWMSVELLTDTEDTQIASKGIRELNLSNLQKITNSSEDLNRFISSDIPDCKLSIQTTLYKINNFKNSLTTKSKHTNIKDLINICEYAYKRIKSIEKIRFHSSHEIKIDLRTLADSINEFTAKTHALNERLHRQEMMNILTGEHTRLPVSEFSTYRIEQTPIIRFVDHAYVKLINTITTALDNEIDAQKERRFSQLIFIFIALLSGAASGYYIIRGSVQNQKILSDKNSLLEKEIKNRTREIDESNQNATSSGARLSLEIEELKKTSQDALHANNEKTAFLTAAGHEIRTPLNGILGMSTLLKDTQLTLTQKNYINTINSSGLALLSILNDITDYSKIGAEEVNIEFSQINLRKLLMEVVELFSCQASAQSVKFYLTIDPACPHVLEGDLSKLKQIMINLLSNAFKFTKQGYIKVSLAIDNGHYIISVKDTGHGISAEDQGALFHPISQTTLSPQSFLTGSGLGLAICKRLIELMNGDIWMESIEGEGSVFYFSLKVDNSELYQPKQTPMNLILVSEDLYIIKEFTLYQNTLGYTLSTFETLGEAIRKGHTYSKLKTCFLIDTATGFDLHKFNKYYASSLQGVSLCFIVDAGVSFEYDQWQTLPTLLEAPMCLSKWYSMILRTLQQESDLIPETAKPALAGLQILVVDDNTINQMVAQGFLSRLNIICQCASSGQEAINILLSQNFTFDCILMDCEMPKMNGFEATRKIRELQTEMNTDIQHLPIIAVTASGTAEQRAKCTAAGMDSLITKPLVLEELESTLQKTLQKTK